MKNLFTKKKLKIINWFYFSFFILANLIALLIGFLYEINFLYSFLISDIFIILVFILLFTVDKKLMTSFYNLENLNKWKKVMVYLFWKIKYLPLLFLLLFSFLALDLKIFFINNFGLIYGAIITFIILLVSEFFRIFYFSSEIENNEKGRE